MPSGPAPELPRSNSISTAYEAYESCNLEFSHGDFSCNQKFYYDDAKLTSSCRRSKAENTWKMARKYVHSGRESPPHVTLAPPSSASRCSYSASPPFYKHCEQFRQPLGYGALLQDLPPLRPKRDVRYAGTRGRKASASRYSLLAGQTPLRSA